MEANKNVVLQYFTAIIVLVKMILIRIMNLKQQLKLALQIAPENVRKDARSNINSILVIYRGFWILTYTWQGEWRCNVYYPSGSQFVLFDEIHTHWKTAIKAGKAVIESLIKEPENELQTHFLDQVFLAS